MRVTLEAALGVTVGLLVASKVPDDQGLVATAREQHVGANQKISSQNPCPNFPHILHRKNFPYIFSLFFFFPPAIVVSTYFSKEVAREVTQPL